MVNLLHSRRNFRAGGRSRKMKHSFVISKKISLISAFSQTFRRYFLDVTLWWNKHNGILYLTHDSYVDSSCHTRVSNSSPLFSTFETRDWNQFLKKIFTQNVIAYGSLASWENWAAGFTSSPVLRWCLH